MAINGRNYLTGKSHNIYIRHSFIKDRVDKGELRVMYCPTHLMLADYVTKPLQGGLFHKFSDIVMVRVITFRLIKDIASYSKHECVENQIPGKHIPLKYISSKKHIPSKELKILED